MKVDMCNFSQESLIFLKEKQSFICEEFFEKNLLARSVENSDIITIKQLYQSSLLNLFNGEVEEFRTKYVRLAEIYIEHEVPYIALINELNHLQNIFLEILIEYDKKDELLTVYKLYNYVQNIVAKEYYLEYLDYLVSISQKRLSSLIDMVDKNVVDHYKDHLEWLLELALSLRQNQMERFPITDKSLCNFGKWLLNDAKNIIKNNSKLKELDRVHTQLHYVSVQIKQIHSSIDEEFDYDVLLTYIEKSELLSLSIGTELALIDNTIVNQKAIKDELTGALGRNVLNQLFYNQYEISLATSSKFVLAMCDLDFFKKINDTYGHVAGDKMLQAFVRIVQKTLRNSDIIIRYGGEEFIIMLPAIDKHNGLKVLNKIKDEFKNYVLDYKGQSISTTVSIGAIEILAEDKYKNSMLEEYVCYADKKLYEAKEDGRDNVK